MRVWCVIDGIEAEDGGPCTEWWLAPFVEHEHEICPITGEPDLVEEEWPCPDLKGPYRSPAIAARWARHYNAKET